MNQDVASFYGITKRIGTLFGTECEIEAISDHQNHDCNWEVTEDHSLRNSGFEYVSKIPLDYQNSVEAFQSLHTSIVYNKKEAFSPRTSTHVHVNVSDLPTSKIRNILLGYVLLEEVFFDFIGETRANNIYCVPLYYTNLTSTYSKPFEHVLGAWHKYTAFNLKPVCTLGTVEFRHLEGTSDLYRYSRWLSFLRSLRECAADVDVFEEGVTNGWLNTARKVCPVLTRDYSDEALMAKIKTRIIDVKLSKGAF
jgi:hypothetical protein